MKSHKMREFDVGIYIFDALVFAQLSPYVLRAVDEFRRFRHCRMVNNMNNAKCHME
jgi:hypothetical protein